MVHYLYFPDKSSGYYHFFWTLDTPTTIGLLPQSPRL
jgi:hypothetical protein